MTAISNRLVSLAGSALLAVLIVHLLGSSFSAEAAQIVRTRHSSYFDKLSDVVSGFKQATFQGVKQARGLLVSLPLGKILLAGGALLSLFFIFIRIIIVFSPIFLLAALTRESTDVGDIIGMLIEFYNRIVIALDDQAPQSR